MSPDYIAKIRQILDQMRWIADRVDLDIETDDDSQIGIISGCVCFKDGSEFHFKELFLTQRRKYRFHYMDQAEQLICRWDNAPHHPHLKTFPDHKHLPDDEYESHPIQLPEALAEVETMAIQRLVAGLDASKSG